MSKMTQGSLQDMIKQKTENTYKSALEKEESAQKINIVTNYGLPYGYSGRDAK